MMKVRGHLPLIAAICAIGLGGPAAALAADEGNGANGDLATQVQAANIDGGQQGQSGVDEQNGANSDLATQVETGNVDEGQVGDGQHDDGQNTTPAPVSPGR